MYQYEKRLDCHALGQEIKRRRKAKGWTQEHLAQLVDLTPRSIMYIENRGQHTSLNAFYKLVTLFDISVDEFFYPDKLGGESERRKHIDRMLNGMDEKELIIIEGVAEGIRKARVKPLRHLCDPIFGTAVFHVKITDHFRFFAKKALAFFRNSFSSSRSLMRFLRARSSASS